MGILNLIKTVSKGMIGEELARQRRQEELRKRAKADIERMRARVGTGVKVASCLAILTLTGCVGPLLFGMKSYQSGTTRIDFITGADVTVGANGIDAVANSRGIKPKFDYDKPEAAR